MSNLLYVLDKKENFLILGEEECLRGKDENNGKVNQEFLKI
jgi:hypothetical protein